MDFIYDWKDGLKRYFLTYWWLYAVLAFAVIVSITKWSLPC